MSAKPDRLTLTRRSVIAATAGLAAAAGHGNYAAAGGGGNYTAAQSTDAGLPAAAQVLTPMMPQAAPALRFTDAGGKSLSFADYAGHGLVVNLWATWCGPCVAEIPSFAAAAPGLARNRILILPISVDMEGAAAVRPFYQSHHINTLPVLLNPDGSAMDVLNAGGIPVTIIINADGRLVARLDGAADWHGADTLAMIRQLTRPATPRGGVMPVSFR